MKNITQVKQSTAAFLYVYLVDATDGYTPETGITGPAVTISKNSGAFAAPSLGTWTELANGWYTVALNAADTATLGPLAVNVVKTGCRNYVDVVEIVSGTVGNIYTRLGTPVNADLASDIAAVNALVVRALGLAHENVYLDNYTYTEGKLTSARIRIYDSAANVGTDNGVAAVYNITATYSGNSLATYQVVKA